MEPEYWAAIATWVGVGVSWIYARRADQAAKHSAAHEQEALEASKASAAAAQKMADLLARREEKRQSAELTASLRAELVPHPRQQGVRLLRVFNSGPAAVDIISVTLSGELIDELTGPLDQATSREHMIPLHMGMPRLPWWVRIEYRDGRPEVQEWKQPLT